MSLTITLKLLNFYGSIKITNLMNCLYKNLENILIFTFNMKLLIGTLIPQL